MKIILPATELSRNEVVNALMLFASLPDAEKEVTLMDHRVFVPISRPELWPNPTKTMVRNIVLYVLHQYGLRSIQDETLAAPRRFWLARQDIDCWLRPIKP